VLFFTSDNIILPILELPIVTPAARSIGLIADVKSESRPVVQRGFPESGDGFGDLDRHTECLRLDAAPSENPCGPDR
jgi:hypothetical protein